MMRIGRSGLGIGGILVATGIMGGIFRPWGPFAGGGPASAGSVQLAVFVVAVLGIGSLATKRFTDRTSKSTFETNGSADSEEALEVLERRYAEGEIDETEFDRKLDILFETETVAEAEHRAESKSVSDEQRPREEPASGSVDRYARPSERSSKRPRPRSRRGHCK